MLEFKYPNNLSNFWMFFELLKRIHCKIFISILIVGIILISVGLYYCGYYFNKGEFANVTTYSWLFILGALITGFDIIGGIVALIRLRRKE